MLKKFKVILEVYADFEDNEVDRAVEIIEDELKTMLNDYVYVENISKILVEEIA